LSLLLMAAYRSATVLSVVPGANAAPPAMADGMMMMTGETGEFSGIGDMGRIFMVSLPAAHSSVATTIAWSVITYAVADDYLRELSIKPALGPPISRA
jgi:hypothetical protein